MTDRIECAVIGAGVVGLAVARALAQSGLEVIVLEAEHAIGTGISSRNSEVIHAGLYYPPGSLKSRLCVQGKKDLYAYCVRNNVEHQRCGKLLVATDEAQLRALLLIHANAAGSGVLDLEWLDSREAHRLEPQLRCRAALLSQSTGIIDSHGLMLALHADLENAGGVVAFASAVSSAKLVSDGFLLRTADGTELLADRVVNAAGLSAPAVARNFDGLDPRFVPQEYFAKGSYFSLLGRSPFSRLIYPVPSAHGLGVHLTLDLGGQARFGPDVQWIDSHTDLVVDHRRGESFYNEIRRYWPDLPSDSLVPGYAGIRPKISGPGQTAADFRIDSPHFHGVPGLINLFGIESPGLTSCLAIGEYVREELT